MTICLLLTEYWETGFQPVTLIAGASGLGQRAEGISVPRQVSSPETPLTLA